MARPRLMEDLELVAPSAAPSFIPKEGVLETPAGRFNVPQITETDATVINPQSEYIITPGGKRLRSLVHHIPHGTVLDGQDFKFRNVTRSGDLIKEFGTVKPHAEGTPLMPTNVTLPPVGPQKLASSATMHERAAPVPAFGNGWITNSGWSNNTGTPISYFATTWRVPPAPIGRSNQVVFLFSGIQNATMIFQPVLQWNWDGGKTWAVSSWYADGQTGTSFHSTPITVRAGDTLLGVMSLTGRNGSNFNYLCEFQGITGSQLPITNVPELTWCCQTLECYGITSAMSYPVTFRTPMKNINIKCGSITPTISWAVNNGVTDCGQHTEVVSNSADSGEVDLCYGTVADSTLSAVTWSSGRLDIFGLGTDDQMYHKSWEGNWGPSINSYDALGGKFNSPPCAVAWGPRRLDIFGLGTDNAMYHKWWNGNWGPSIDTWEYLGGTFDSPPSAVAWSANRLDIFGLGTDNQCYHKSWNGNQWSGWDGLGGVFNCPPAAVALAPNKLDIFGLGTDNQMYHKYWDGTKWGPSVSGWDPLGGIFNSAPSAVSWGPDKLDIFGLGTDNQCYHKWWDGSNGGSVWGPSISGWEALGGKFNSVPVAKCWGPNRIDIFGLGTDNQCYHKWWDGSSWGPSISAWEPLGGVFNSIPTVTSWGANRLDIFGLGTDNSMYHKSWDGRNWGPSISGWENLGGIFDSD